MVAGNQQHTNMPNVSMEGTTLHVENVERSLEFYIKIPGVQILAHRPGIFALLAIGNGRLGLVKYGPTHVEFDTPDPDALYLHLKEAGLPVEDPPSSKFWGEYDFTIHDPDGHCLEFDSPQHQSFTGNSPSQE
jgi:catechol 2,3-dioxygenase-like lactoylglutathione lyase family enzyme